MPLRFRTTASTAPIRNWLRLGWSGLGLCIVGVGLIAACLPWPVKAPHLLDLVVDEVRRSYGIALTVEGGTHVALLPFPRLNIARARLNAGTPDGELLAEGGSLSLQLSLLAILSGRIDVDALSLDGAAVTLPMSSADQRWNLPLQNIAARIRTASGAEAKPSRFTLTRATLTGIDPRDGTVQTVTGADLSLSSPFWSHRTELMARGNWHGSESRLHISGLDIAALLAGRESGFSTNTSWPAGSLALSGTMRVDGGLQMTGRAKLATRSVPETLDWSGGGVALAPLTSGATVEADFKGTGKDFLLPRMRMEVGSNRFEGAGAVSFADNRVAIQATVAADTLNVAPLVGELIGALGLSSERPDWKERRLSLGSFTAGDLDLRLSAASARIGPVLVEDIASGLIVREGSIEATIGRATLQGGVVKGRIAFGLAPDRQTTDLKMQGAFDGLDLGDLLADLGEYRWLVGAVRGTLAVESRAATMGDLVARLGGRATIASDDGAISGLDLVSLMQRERSPATDLPLQPVGRTDFARAGVSLRVKDGLCEIAEGTLTSPNLTAALGGTLSLVERRVDAQADISSQGGGPARSFEIAGPWNTIVVRPAALRRSESDPGGLAVVKPDPMRFPPKADLPGSARAYAP